jgi:hypothetical protein
MRTLLSVVSLFFAQFSAAHTLDDRTKNSYGEQFAWCAALYALMQSGHRPLDRKREYVDKVETYTEFSRRLLDVPERSNSLSEAALKAMQEEIFSKPMPAKARAQHLRAGITKCNETMDALSLAALKRLQTDGISEPER